MAEHTAAKQAGLPAHLRDDLKWKPGQSGNPNGRPKGARSILQEDFFKALQRKFEENGEAVLDEMIREKPADFARMIAGLMTKELDANVSGDLSPEMKSWLGIG